MSISIKVRGGTAPSGDAPLCKTCRYYEYRRYANNHERHYCTDMGLVLPGPVIECTEYQHKNTPSLPDMQSSAFILRTDASGRAIGFVSNKEYRKRYGDPSDD